MDLNHRPRPYQGHLWCYMHSIMVIRKFSVRLDAVNVGSIRNSNQFQIVRCKDLPFRVLHFQSAHGFSGPFVQNLKTFLAAGEEITFSPLAQSNDDREQLSAFGPPNFPLFYLLQCGLLEGQPDRRVVAILEIRPLDHHD